VGSYWAASIGEADNEADATPQEENLLCCWPGYGSELVGSSAAAGTDELGTHWGAVGLACGRSRQTLPAGGMRGAEQDCGGG